MVEWIKNYGRVDKKLWLSGLKTTAFLSNTQKGGAREEGPERRGQKGGAERGTKKGGTKEEPKGNQKGGNIKEGFYRRG